MNHRIGESASRTHLFELPRDRTASIALTGCPGADQVLLQMKGFETDGRTALIRATFVHSAVAADRRVYHHRYALLPGA